MASLGEEEQDQLTIAGLAALERFASEALRPRQVPLTTQRTILLLAWETARKGELDDAAEGLDASLSAEDAALAELGAVTIAAGIEASLAKSGRRSQATAASKHRGPWEALCFRVDACARAAAFAGLSQETCGDLRRVGAALLLPYREDLEVAEAGKTMRSASPPVKGERANLWILQPQSDAKLGATEWRGPLTARQVLRFSEMQEFGPDMLVYGLADPQQTAGASSAPYSEPSQDPRAKERARPLWRSFDALGLAVRKDAELAGQQKASLGI